MGKEQITESWHPSVKLRWVNRSSGLFFKAMHSNNAIEKRELILQQLFTSNLGNSKWEDVHTEHEH